jgi:hypothetical protein
MKTGDINYEVHGPQEKERLQRGSQKKFVSLREEFKMLDTLFSGI